LLPPVAVSVALFPAQILIGPEISATGNGLIVKVTGVRVLLKQPVAGSSDSVYHVPAATGWKEVLLSKIGAPPVAVVYQFTCNPAVTLTTKAGSAVPWQTAALLPVGGGIVGQLQLGVLTEAVAVQALLIALMTVSVTDGTVTGILITLLPEMVPAVVDKTPLVATKLTS